MQKQCEKYFATSSFQFNSFADHRVNIFHIAFSIYNNFAQVWEHMSTTHENNNYFFVILIVLNEKESNSRSYGLSYCFTPSCDFRMFNLHKSKPMNRLEKAREKSLIQFRLLLLIKWTLYRLAERRANILSFI